ncbi:filamentous hemagglutinin N-terminal domain-containing protein [Paraburkholderia sp. MMS20-SJTN17]|uniref:Filamentous hemagglutinin N-terminal domain-containing protein n=1 Tax=Paraburkholderia translucens TaxID=2886945 RepID=A0ABS8KA89_9BURK|nr:filamentous hemagglutinin N-terminal domain-containing protein [Paraburkholderia sp. MMS20-SJTN17]MCC8401661.1 filamentous hemagglutinin N-terminal domain-containing protein [Paraburkholderia sp. MMS20-SJTN17]
MSDPELPRPARRPLHRGQTNGGLWLAVGISLIGMSFAHVPLTAGVLPQGGTYVAGAGAIAGQGNGLLITQPGSTRGVIEWNSFSVGRNNSVTFDNGSGATLNRVTGGSPSAILGRLSATGSLYVINPQGIVVGPSGVISTGDRFVASTLDICDDAFIKGSGALKLSGNADASVINLGRISSSGGDVFLIARSAVINAGAVSAPNGTAELAAGGQVLLQNSASSRQVFVQTGSQGAVVNRGRITAAQISLQAADGNVYALAGGGTRIRATGTASREGHVWLVADSGRIKQSAKIAATNADGSGGTVDTQAAHLAFGKDAMVDAGQWNLSTPAFTIDDAAAHALQRSLNAGTSVDLTTTGANEATGDLAVASSLRWSGPASLTLAAYHEVSVTTDATIANHGAGNLILRADASGIGNGGNVTNHGTLDWSASTGAVSALYDMNGSYLAGTQRTNPEWAAAEFSGLVTQITSYKLVNSLVDLTNVASDLASNYALGRNIDAGATRLPPIGSINLPFTGQFDGAGHTIRNFTLGAVPGDHGERGSVMGAHGMFGVIGSAGIVRNLNLAGSTTESTSLIQFASYGVLAGVNYGTVLFDSTAGSINLMTGFNYVTYSGGLVGYNYGLIQRSSSSVSVAAQYTVGGLVGDNLAMGRIVQSYASGNVTAGPYSGGGGGLAGINGGSVAQSYATGSVRYIGSCPGGNSCGSAGLVQSNSGTISESFAVGPVLQRPAGIVAFNSVPISTDVFWNTETTLAPVAVLSGPGLPASNGLTTAQMSMASSFASYDFGPNGTWAMPAGASHPILRWQLAHP